MPTTERQRHQVMKMDLEQARRALLVAMAADIPCAMWGEAGFAKSATNHWVTRVVQRRMFDVRLSYYEETDLAGYPSDAGDGSSRFLRPRFMPYKGNVPDDIKALLFLDEYDRATERVQNGTLQLLSNRRIGEHELVDDCPISLAGNAATDTFTTQLSEATATRIVHIYLDVTSARTLDHWLKWAEAADLVPAVRAFARERWEEICEFHTDPSSDLELSHPIKPNFRTLEMASDLIKTAEALEDAGVTIDGEPLTTADLVVPMLAGTVTVGPAVQIYALHKAAIGEREIDQILEHPETAPVEDNGRTWLIGNALLRRVQSTRARHGQNSPDVLEAADQTAAYARRLPAEVATWLMRDLVRHAPEAATVRNYQAWSNANQ